MSKNIDKILNIFLFKQNFNLFEQSSLGTQIFNNIKEENKSRREILFEFWKKEGDWISNIKDILK
tara:strand:- start:92 stop:286 length:195 start_codon:yes stop_codon:yes gene_type:complete